jgi:hypothetical protein
MAGYGHGMKIEDTLRDAQRLFRAGQKLAAIDLLEKKLSSEPDHLQAASLLSQFYLESGRPEEAAHWIERAQQGEQSGMKSDPSDKPEQAEQLTDADIGYFQEISSPSWNELCVFDDSIEREPVPADEESGRLTKHLSESAPGNRTLAINELPSGSLISDRSHDLSPGYEHEVWSLDEVPPDDDDEADDGSIFADIAWEDFAYPELSPGAFDEGETTPDPDDRLTREDRARQVAGEIATRADWSRQEIAPLVEALAYHRCHHATRKALTILILENGMTSDELAILLELRSYWPTYGYSRSYRSGEAVDGWESLPWRFALRMVRQLRTDNSEEAMRFIEDCFEDWSAQPSRMAIPEYHSQPYFLGYLEHLLNHMHDMTERWCQAMPPEIDFQLFPNEDEPLRRGSRAWRELEELGLPSHPAREIWLRSDGDKAP